MLDALDRVEEIRNRATIAGPTFAAAIEDAYMALNEARYEVDSWKASE